MKYYAYIEVFNDEMLDKEEKLIRRHCLDKSIKIEEIFIDNTKARNLKKQYNLLINILVAGDTLIIKELNLLGKNVNSMAKEWKKLQMKKINVVVIDNEPFTTNGKSTLEKRLISNIVFELLSYLTQKEKEEISKKIKVGIKKAKDKGVKLGRPQVVLSGKFNVYYNQWKDKKIKAVEFANLINVSRSTLYRYINQYEEERHNINKS